MSSTPRRICFITGTRAEFGLMSSALHAIKNDPDLTLQIIATGMHLDPRHGSSLDAIRQSGWPVDGIIPWPPGGAWAANLGGVIAGLSNAFADLDPDVVLVVGDRVEAFAGASAAHVSGRIVAHVHGGDRALGQIDDSLRHAVTKLSHLHFPATPRSARRLLRLGEDTWRIHPVGSPGIDGIVAAATPRSGLAELYPDLQRGRYALLMLHPTDSSGLLEYGRATMLLEAVAHAQFTSVLIVYPNNDPGSDGIIRAWQEAADGGRARIEKDLPRADFLGLMRDAAVLVGNSSSGIIEAASFGTPVIDVGERQAGRERSGNAIHAPFVAASLRRALRRVWNDGRPTRWRGKNVYGGRGVGERMARVLAQVDMGSRLRRKLITY